MKQAARLFSVNTGRKRGLFAASAVVNRIIGKTTNHVLSARSASTALD
jgi:hypothetical protein